MLPGEIKEFISKDLEIQFDFDGQRKEDLIRAISIPVRKWLAEDMEKLLSVLYRIDVDEQKFKEVIASFPPEELHEEIARLIVDRQIQKLRYRKEFGSGTH